MLKRLCGIMLCLILGMTGCSGRKVQNDMQNVEERDYATILMAGRLEEGYHFAVAIAQEKVVGEKSMVEELFERDAANLEEFAIAYENVMGKDLSLAHLKAIITEEDPAQWGASLLTMLGKEPEIAKTCPVLETSDLKWLCSYLEGQEEPVGKKLENCIRVREKQGMEIPWLMDYEKRMREQKPLQPLLLVPYGDDFYIEEAHLSIS